MNSLLTKEDGISLVEVLASIIILTIVILSVFHLLVQSSKTTKTSDNIIDATYVAQKEMEELYLLSKNQPPGISFVDAIIDGINYKGSDVANTAFQGEDNSGNVYEYYLKNNHLTDLQIRLTLPPSPSPQLKRVVIRVYDKSGEVLKAQMETTLDWGA